MRIEGADDRAGRSALRHATALEVFEGADGGRGEAVGDVASHQLGGFGGAAVHDEGHKLGVFLSLSNVPPTYLEVGSIDILAGEGLSYAGRLLACGVATELHVYPGAYHALDVIAPAAPLTVAARARRLRAMVEL